MGLAHDFLLLDRESDGEWELSPTIRRLTENGLHSWRAVTTGWSLPGVSWSMYCDSWPCTPGGSSPRVASCICSIKGYSAESGAVPDFDGLTVRS